MKKILTMVAMAIAMPAMAQSLEDGRSCQEWKIEYSTQVDRLKTELSTMKLNAKAENSSVSKADNSR